MNDTVLRLKKTNIKPGKSKTCEAPTPLRLDALIINPSGVITHEYKFDWAALNERWAFTVRAEDVLRQGFGVILMRTEVHAEVLTKRFPMHG